MRAVKKAETNSIERAHISIFKFKIKIKEKFSLIELTASIVRNWTNTLFHGASAGLLVIACSHPHEIRSVNTSSNSFDLFHHLQR